MKITLANTENEITSPNTSVHSTIVYALGVAIQQETDATVKKDLKAVEKLIMESEEMIIITL